MVFKKIHKLSKYSGAISFLAIFLIPLSFQQVNAELVFDKNAKMPSPSTDWETFAEKNLLPCQVSTLERPLVKQSDSAKTTVKNILKRKYPSLSSADLDFMVRNPKILPLAYLLPRIAANFVEISCNNFVHDHTQVDALQHFAFTLAAGLMFGKEKACELSTAHEIKNTFPLKIKGLENPNVLVNKKTPEQPVYLGPAERMDLMNNKIALGFLEKHPELARSCFEEINIRMKFRNKSEFEQYNYKGWIGDKEDRDYKEAAKIAGVKGSCEKISHLLLEKKPGVDLIYLREGVANQCNPTTDSEPSSVVEPSNR